jgi:GNAT superfamily N-acetyltransferase
MLRRAAPADLPDILEIRDSVRENGFSDPSAVTASDSARLIDQAAYWVWQEPDRRIAGFSASDISDGTIVALFVAPGHEGKGIGRALLKAACGTLRTAGHRAATLSTDPGTRAERHYRADGWSVIGTNAKGALIFQKEL